MGPTCCAWIIAACLPLPSTSALAPAVGNAGSAPTTECVPGGWGWWEELTRGATEPLSRLLAPPHLQVCSNEGKCICQPDWTGKDCSIHNPLPTSPPTGETERYKGETAAGRDGALSLPFPAPVPANRALPSSPGPSGTNIIIGSIAGAVLVAAIVLGGTGWGFK